VAELQQQLSGRDELLTLAGEQLKAVSAELASRQEEMLVRHRLLPQGLDLCCCLGRCFNRRP
jgi:hypothetical protein